MTISAFEMIKSLIHWTSESSLANPASNYPLMPYRDMISFPNAAYGPTKAVLHWLTKAMQIEEPKLNAFSVHPG